MKFQDEQEQEELVARLASGAAAREALYRRIFSVVVLVPTPLFVFGSDARKSPVFALTALLCVCFAALCISRPFGRGLKMSSVLAGLILMRSYIRFGLVGVWLLPLCACVTGLVLERWFREIRGELERLKRAQYPLMGA